jgi:Zn-dependent M28 family amino/carboxypeptidase
MKNLAAALALFASVSVPAAAQTAALDAVQRKAIDRLIAAGLADERACAIVESLTTEIGPRLGGTQAEARAREWGVRTLKELGFSNVRIETYEMPAWTRVSEKAAIVAPFPQALQVTALGNSVSTPEGGLSAPVVRFETMTALANAPMTGLEGKIVFVDERMTRTQDGSGYGVAVAKRSAAAYEAGRRGAAAAVIRSVGTDGGRRVHTGNMTYKDGAPQIPAAALSNADADQLARAIAASKAPVVLALELKTKSFEKQVSGNVIGEIPGRTDELVVIGGHLDSWDLGTGAVDDASGIAITVAAAKLVDAMKGKPGRTIRVVMWGAEEVGLHGAKAYAERHKDDMSLHALAAESDFGAGPVWQVATRFGVSAEGKRALFAEALRPLGVGPGGNDANGGADVGPLRTAGVPVLDLRQDGTDYFDLHHTPEDTFDKIDKEALRQNVAAWAAMLYLATELPGGFRDAPAAP